MKLIDKFIFFCAVMANPIVLAVAVGEAKRVTDDKKDE